MLPYKTMFEIDKESRMPIYIQIANGFIKQISRGSIQSGLKLPGTRTLAKEFNLHRKTVVAAYDELNAQGWIEIIPAKGCFVSSKIPIQKVKNFGEKKIPFISPLKKASFEMAGKQVDILDYALVKTNEYTYQFDDGCPDVRMTPIKDFARHYRSLLSSHSKWNLNYTWELKGNLQLRNELVKYLAETRGINVTKENILMTRGSIMGFYLIFRTLLKKGDAVIVGETNYLTANKMVREIGGKILTVPVDDDGINVDEVERICKKRKVRAIYVVPHHHHPTTVSLSCERRAKLLMLAEEYKFAIIEDDYDYDFHYDNSPILPLASSDRSGSVAYVGSFSKSVAPSIRIGFVVAAENVINQLTGLRRIIDRQGDIFMEKAIALMIENGELRRHLRKAHKVYHERRDIFCSLMKNELKDAVEFKVPEGGLATWVKFDDAIDLNVLRKRIKKKNLFMVDHNIYNQNGKNINSVRMGFASMNKEELEISVDILKNELYK